MDGRRSPTSATRQRMAGHFAGSCRCNSGMGRDQIWIRDTSGLTCEDLGSIIYTSEVVMICKMFFGICVWYFVMTRYEDTCYHTLWNGVRLKKESGWGRCLIAPKGFFLFLPEGWGWCWWCRNAMHCTCISDTVWTLYSAAPTSMERKKSRFKVEWTEVWIFRHSRDQNTIFYTYITNYPMMQNTNPRIHISSRFRPNQRAR